MLGKLIGMKFDKTPTLIYIQHENHGIGELYLNGKKLHGLQEIEIIARTNDGSVSFPKLKLKIVPEELAKFGTMEE